MAACKVLFVHFSVFSMSQLFVCCLNVMIPNLEILLLRKAKKPLSDWKIPIHKPAKVYFLFLCTMVFLQGD